VRLTFRCLVADFSLLGGAVNAKCYTSAASACIEVSCADSFVVQSKFSLELVKTFERIRMKDITRNFKETAYSMLFLLACSFSGLSFAQIDGVGIRMESGKLIEAKDLPWLQLADFSYDDKSKKPPDAYWVVYSPPKFCPYSYYYWYSNVRLSTEKRNQSRDECSKNLIKKYLNDSPDEVKKYCQCKLVLETEQPQTSAVKQAVWVSYDDELLANQGYHIKWTILNKSEKLPVMVSISREAAGIYNFSGDVLCEFDLTRHIGPERRIDKMLESLLKNGSNLIPVKCLGLVGTLNISGISYSLIRGRIVGSARLKFSNGEQYEIDPS